jgi:hypothetical protein
MAMSELLTFNCIRLCKGDADDSLAETSALLVEMLLSWKKVRSLFVAQ